MSKVIGIDIGGTKIYGIVFNNGKVVKSKFVPTPNNLESFKEQILEIILDLSNGDKITSVGIGIAGGVDPVSGVITRSPNIPFINNFNTVKFLKSRGFKKVAVDNDANCFTRAELLVGQGKKLSNFLGITLGTGIGGGIVINKNIYRGKDHNGAEFGHMYLEQDFFEKEFQVLRDSKDFVKAGELIGKALASLINVFSPEAIVIGGGYGINETAGYLASAKNEITKYIFNKKNKTKILISKIKNSGAIGAALLVK